VLWGIGFSPDGKRIIAGDYPGGIIQVWDVETGNELTTIETGYAYHASNKYFHVTPDWKSLYSPRTDRKLTRIERDGKALRRWEFNGEIRSWDVTTGELMGRFGQTVPRSVIYTTLSPNGRFVLAGHELAGEYESHPPRRVSLWNTESRTVCDISESGRAIGVFSADSTRVALSEFAERFCTDVGIFDTTTGDKILTIPLDEEFALATPMGFSPDGAMLIGRLEVYPEGNYRNQRRSWLRFWDTATGEAVASIEVGHGEDFSWPAVFSPDESTLAVTNWLSESPALYLIDLARREIDKTVRLGNKKAAARTPAFSPDGRWIAVITQEFPEETARQEPAAEDLPQPRIHLVEVATGEVIETIIAPQGIATSLAFSPDGKTLASGGHGRVLLWDLSVPPGELATK
jgi:hypothetical protein